MLTPAFVASIWVFIFLRSPLDHKVFVINNFTLLSVFFALCTLPELLLSKRCPFVNGGSLIVFGCCSPSFLAMAIAGPARAARIPLIGPKLVRLLLGDKHWWLEKFKSIYAHAARTQARHTIPNADGAHDPVAPELVGHGAGVIDAVSLPAIPSSSEMLLPSSTGEGPMAMDESIAASSIGSIVPELPEAYLTLSWQAETLIPLPPSSFRPFAGNLPLPNVENAAELNIESINPELPESYLALSWQAETLPLRRRTHSF